MTPDDLRTISAELRDAINANSAADAAALEDGKRWHLGCSIIGQECLRKTWYDYRWMTPRRMNGRMARLFARGHAEERLIIALLERKGWLVQSATPATGEQSRFTAVHGHYGGACDGIASYTYANGDAYRLLLEMKTHNTKSFCHVAEKGVIEGKPQHYTQMSCYGKGFDLAYGLYFAVNKNDDDIYVEFVALDHDLAGRMELRAESLILAREPPPRISNKSTDFRCKMCDHAPVCHSGVKPPQHCRSCVHSFPVDAGEWTCAYYSAIIPRDVAKVGCPQWEALLR